MDHEIADLLSQHQEPVRRLPEVPGLGVDSAQWIIPEVGTTAATPEPLRPDDMTKNHLRRTELADLPR